METNNLKNELVPVPLPNSSAILMLGIFSIVIACCCPIFSLVGLILGIVALALSPRTIEIYTANPGKYTESSFKNVSAGKICAIIGVVITGLLMMVGIIYAAVVGGAIWTIFDKIPWENYF